ncbi:hypothetical protein BDQ17DRAFT_392957 [Cyathus striatus]|nr:hypothetical protein BDQ17DRAFT_392957 [Cyathus striatus]
MDNLDNINIETTQEILIQNFLHILALSIQYYDHLITTGDEINYLWKRPKGTSTFWFFLNRYFAFFGNLVVIILSFTTIPNEVRFIAFTFIHFEATNSLIQQSCKAYNFFWELLLVLNQVVVCILLALRIYALYSRSIRILACMVGSGVVLFIIICWSLFGQKIIGSQPEPGCHEGATEETAIHIASAWEALMIYDTMIFSFILYRTWTTRRDDRVTGIHIPLLSLILRDGAVYYVAMALANLSNILTFYLCGPFIHGALSTFASRYNYIMLIGE